MPMGEPGDATAWAGGSVVRGGADCAGGGGRAEPADGCVVVRYTATRSIRASAKGDCQEPEE
eukprot:scaffold109176_cov62-Phaeocystis_antarctica.AAC.1